MRHFVVILVSLVAAAAAYWTPQGAIYRPVLDPNYAEGGVIYRPILVPPKYPEGVSQGAIYRPILVPPKYPEGAPHGVIFRPILVPKHPERVPIGLNGYREFARKQDLLNAIRYIVRAGNLRKGEVMRKAFQQSGPRRAFQQRPLLHPFSPRHRQWHPFYRTLPSSPFISFPHPPPSSPVIGPPESIEPIELPPADEPNPELIRNLVEETLTSLVPSGSSGSSEPLGDDSNPASIANNVEETVEPLAPVETEPIVPLQGDDSNPEPVANIVEETSDPLQPEPIAPKPIVPAPVDDSNPEPTVTPQGDVPNPEPVANIVEKTSDPVRPEPVVPAPVDDSIPSSADDLSEKPVETEPIVPPQGDVSNPEPVANIVEETSDPVEPDPIAPEPVVDSNPIQAEVHPGEEPSDLVGAAETVGVSDASTGTGLATAAISTAERLKKLVRKLGDSMNHLVEAIETGNLGSKN